MKEVLRPPVRNRHTAAMFAVLFEVEPKPERWDDYLRHAAALRPELLAIDGFLDNRRFSRRARPGSLLSLSYWRDEKALIRWRTHALHHDVQAAGRNLIFRGYHLRVGEVTHDNGVALPRTRFDETASGNSRAATIIEAPASETPPNAPGLAACDVFEEITVPGSTLLLLVWKTGAAMRAWPPTAGSRRTDVSILRDYSMEARGEAPQYFPPVQS